LSDLQRADGELLKAEFLGAFRFYKTHLVFFFNFLARLFFFYLLFNFFLREKVFSDRAQSIVNPLPPSDAVRKQNFILEDFFSSVLSKF